MRAKAGRPGGNRTPNPRFWRPVLCQLSYWPSRLTRVGTGAWGLGAGTTQPPVPSLQPLLRLLVRSMFSAEAAELRELQPLGRFLLVLRRAVVAPLALGARERDQISHWSSP